MSSSARRQHNDNDNKRAADTDWSSRRDSSSQTTSSDVCVSTWAALDTKPKPRRKSTNELDQSKSSTKSGFFGFGSASVGSSKHGSAEDHSSPVSGLFGSYKPDSSGNNKGTFWTKSSSDVTEKSTTTKSFFGLGSDRSDTSQNRTRTGFLGFDSGAVSSFTQWSFKDRSPSSEYFSSSEPDTSGSSKSSSKFTWFGSSSGSKSQEGEKRSLLGLFGSKSSGSTKVSSSGGFFTFSKTAKPAETSSFFPKSFFSSSSKTSDSQSNSRPLSGFFSSNSTSAAAPSSTQNIRDSSDYSYFHFNFPKSGFSESVLNTAISNKPAGVILLIALHILLGINKYTDWWPEWLSRRQHPPRTSQQTPTPPPPPPTPASGSVPTSNLQALSSQLQAALVSKKPERYKSQETSTAGKAKEFPPILETRGHNAGPPYDAATSQLESSSSSEELSDPNDFPPIPQTRDR